MKFLSYTINNEEKFYVKFTFSLDRYSYTGNINELFMFPDNNSGNEVYC